ncbi:hypothetical protein ACFLT7_05030, partial [candidate division KSB1 bacterium]
MTGRNISDAFLLFCCLVIVPAGYAAAANGQVLIDNGTARTTIVIDFGPYTDAWAAGNSENQVDWSDRDQILDRICTEAFAALELRYFLCRLGGLAPSDRSNIPIVDIDSGVPESSSIIVVGRAVSRLPY